MTFSFINENQIEIYKRRIILITGLGFFTDAYDLFVIGIVTVILAPLWHLSSYQVGLLNAVSLAAAAMGAILFGILADRFGRKTFYGSEMVLLSIGAFLSAISTDFICLLLSRTIIGLGIGGDYSTSAIIASEYGTTKDRGKLVLLVFSMQCLGLIVGPLFASFLLAIHFSPELTWRLLFLAGAFPPLIVFFLRRRIQETPRFLLTQPLTLKNHPKLKNHHALNFNEHLNPLQTVVFNPQRLLTKKWSACLFGTASAWFLFDIAFYGNTVSSMLILKSLNPGGSLLMETLISTLIFLFFAAPGYYLAAWYVDRIGRKFMQVLGFSMMGTIYLLITLVPSLPEHVLIFIIVFGMSYFFVNFGPNATTFLIPSEIYPANLRAKGHGISVAIGKIGAFLGVFILPILLTIYGITSIFLFLAVVSFLGTLSTLFIPEMSQCSIDNSEIINNFEDCETECVERLKE